MMNKRVIVKTVAGMLLAGILLGVGEKSAYAAKEKVDAYGEYHAALGVQTDSYRRVFRDAYFDGKNEKRSDYGQLLRETGREDEFTKQDGEFKDVTIKGNGTYSVTLKNADFSGDRNFRKLYVATDIPNTEDIHFSNMSVSINGKVLRTFDEAVLDVSKMYRANCVLLAIHPVNEDVKNAISTRNVPQTSKNTIKITFTVDGFGYEKGQVPQTPEPEPTDTPDATQIPEVIEETPKAEKTQEVTKQPAPAELSDGRKAGIAVTVTVAIAGILGCVIVVTRRSR